MENDGSEAVAQIYVMCGEGHLFLDFLQTLIDKKTLTRPVRAFRNEYDHMKHANFFTIEAIGHQELVATDIVSLRAAGVISDAYKIDTFAPLSIARDEMQQWLRDRAGPCSLQFYMRHRDQLARSAAARAAKFERQLSSLIVNEWHPYLAGKRRSGSIVLANRLSLDLRRNVHL